MGIRLRLAKVTNVSLAKQALATAAAAFAPQFTGGQKQADEPDGLSTEKSKKFDYI